MTKPISEVLPPQAKKRASEIRKDPKLALQFLRKAGIIAKTGHGLTARYR